MNNEEQLREEFRNILWQHGESIDDGMVPTKLLDEMADWWTKALLQAELNWLTAQIERLEEKRPKRRHAECWNGKAEPCENCIAFQMLDNVLEDLISPLIERKKEVEKLLGKTEGV